jgi:hypothetical protein
MEAHVLNGDALAEKFPFPDNIIVCRECLIDGPINISPLNLFWESRATFIADEFKSNKGEYFDIVVSEFEKLGKTEADTINLWFEHDLFCQANLWFTLDFIATHTSSKALYVVMPEPIDDPTWSGFGPLASQELLSLYKSRVRVNATDLRLAQGLWNAFQRGDINTIQILSTQKSQCFPMLKQVCDAHLDRLAPLSRPESRLRKILAAGISDFQTVFNEFRRTEAIYGFGDIQVKKLLNKIV